MPATYRIYATVQSPLVEKAVKIISRELQERSGLSVVNSPAGEASLVLDVQPGIGTDGFRIENLPDGRLAVTGDNGLGLLHGVGKLLHGARYADGVFTPGTWRGVSVPECPMRGIYFALHENFYSYASVEELERYMEELAMWGLNVVAFHLPQPLDPTAPEAQAVRARNHAILKAAKETGMKIALLNSMNIGMEDATPDMLAAEFPDTDPPRRGFHGIRVCPSNPAGFAYLSKMMGEYLDGYQDIGMDYAVTFPYDSGGCGCSECWPWGAKGFVKISREFSRLARERYPDVELVHGTWCYDVCEESDGEWEGLTQALAEDKSWVHYIMADSHFEFPRYPLDHGVPGNLPLVNFAEISMWGRFPWGGFGANPLPARFQEIWDQTEGKLAGGLPYSEGNFEDINKVLFARFFWDKGAKAADTVREYIAFEYAPEVVELVAEAIDLLERTYPRETWQKADILRAHELMLQADALLPERAKQSWRWRILYLRAVVDYELIMNDGQLSDRCDEAYEELTRIFHLENGWQCVTPRSRRFLTRQQEMAIAEERPPGADL
ncbi:MAG: hypothetical protein ACYDBB_17915 [Armatimonadota bacterium]